MASHLANTKPWSGRMLEYLLNGSLWTNFSEILFEIYIFSLKEMHLKMFSAKWRLFCLGLNVLSTCHTFSGKPCRQLWGDNFCTCQYFTWISPGLACKCACKSNLPADRFWACSNFVQVSCGYLNTKVIAKHKHVACKGRNLLVYIPLKKSRMAVGLWPSRTSSCHLWSYCEFLRTRKGLYSANLRVYSHFCGHGMECIRMLRVSYCLPADILRAACDQVAGDL